MFNLDDMEGGSYRMEDFTHGIPSAKAHRAHKVARDWFLLGKTAAALDQQSMENRMMRQMMDMQQMMLSQQKNQISDQLNQVQNTAMSVKDMKDQMVQMSAPPPPLPANVGLPGGVPPLPPEVGAPGGYPPLPPEVGAPGQGLPPMDSGPSMQPPPINFG